VKPRYAAIGLCVLLLAAGCSSVKTRYAYDSGADLEQLRTYAWIPPPAPSPDEPADETERRSARDQWIRQAVDEQLARKGLRMVASDPDLLVIFHVIREDKIDVDDWGYSYAARKRYRNPKGFGMVEVAQYEKGTLILDFVNPGTNQLVWRGEAQGGLAPDLTEKQGKKICDKAVEKVLKHFPPPASS